MRCGAGAGAGVVVFSEVGSAVNNRDDLQG